MFVITEAGQLALNQIVKQKGAGDGVSGLLQQKVDTIFKEIPFLNDYTVCCRIYLQVKGNVGKNILVKTLQEVETTKICWLSFLIVLVSVSLTDPLCSVLTLIVYTSSCVSCTVWCQWT